MRPVVRPILSVSMRVRRGGCEEAMRGATRGSVGVVAFYVAFCVAFCVVVGVLRGVLCGGWFLCCAARGLGGLVAFRGVPECRACLPGVLAFAGGLTLPLEWHRW